MLTAHSFKAEQGKLRVYACGKSMLFNCTKEQYLKGMDAYNNGKLVQYAFSFLSVDEREFLLTGITPEEWTKLFGEED